VVGNIMKAISSHNYNQQSKGLIFYGMDSISCGTTPIELGLVGACTLVDSIIYVMTIKAAS